MNGQGGGAGEQQQLHPHQLEGLLEGADLRRALGP